MAVGSSCLSRSYHGDALGVLVAREQRGGAFDSHRVQRETAHTAIELDEAFVDLFLEIKRQNGYSQGEIDRKRLSLEGVLVPVTVSPVEDKVVKAPVEVVVEPIGVF